jgi:arsenate reductase
MHYDRQMPIKFYEYAKCSTCVKARKWLEAAKVKCQIIPMVDEPPSAAELKSYIEKSGLEIKKFFNTSGVVYREENIAAKIPTMSHKEMITLLAGNGKLIKRPLLVDGDTVLVGFREPDYKKHFK